jgi:phage shock protein C
MNNHLYRSRDDRMLAGVAGGLAEMWDADPSLVRIVWALLVVLTGGIALVVYIVMAIVVPEEDDPRVWAGQPNRWDGPAAPAGGTTAEAAAAAPSTAGGDPAAAPGTAGGTAAGFAPATAWQPGRHEARAAAAAARRDARAARRAGRDRDGRPGAIIIGALLVLLGAWFLVRQYLPTVDWDWFWPLILVALGVVVLVLAVRPRSDGPHDGGSVGGGSAGS